MASISQAMPDDRRRKVRKGTRSCWACKRKKIKCTFRGTDSPCLSCRRHGTSCVLQDVDDSDEFQQDATSVGGRLHKIEHLLEVLLQQRYRKGDAVAELPDSPSAAAGHTEDVAGSNGPSARARLSADNNVVWRQAVLQSDAPQQSLLAAWPPLHYVNMLFGGGSQKSDTGASLLHGMIFQSSDKVSPRNVVSPTELLESPAPTTQPILIARQLLLLALCLQEIPTAEADRVCTVRIDHREIRLKAVRASSQVVTGNDDYAGSIEHVECLMLESSYWNNEGDFHRAYLALHRALAASRILGLDCGVNVTASVALDDKTKDRVDSTCMWFRMVQSDRYLSLLLGLPSMTADSYLHDVEPCVNACPVEYLERVHCVVGGLLLRQSDAGMTDVHATNKMDKMLQRCMSSLPPQWWLTVDISSPTSHDTEAMTRVTNQLVHYHLLQRVHLPYLLHHTSVPSYDYSLVTAVQASREILTRFISYRKMIRGNSFCRGTNFLAFMSALILCLGHIRNSPVRGNGCFQSNAGAALLSHQRFVDRGTIERVVHIMQTHHACADELDTTTEQIINVTKRLLDMEAASATGQCFEVTHNVQVSTSGHQTIRGFTGTLSEGLGLTMTIPYIGVVRVDVAGQVGSRVVEAASTDTLPVCQEHGDGAVNCHQHSQALQQVDLHPFPPTECLSPVPDLSSLWNVYTEFPVYHEFDGEHD